MRPAALLIAALSLATGLAGCGGRQGHSAVPADAGAGTRFLAKNAKEAGVVTLPDGLQYKVLHSGPAGAPSPQRGDEIKINYEGALIDGTVFDSTYRKGQPAVMGLEDLVPGWMEALPKMHVGDVWYLYLPSRLGYGERGAGGVIPPNAVLVFKIELLGVLPARGSHDA
jgi:peptidylprolyl isomerase/FKBP-type peptidyl-prolyl cis-trans isomerase FklB